MNYSIFRFTLNMHSHRSQASISAFHGDTAIRLYITITDGGNPYHIEDGCTAILSGTKADGTKLWNRCVIENNAIIRYDFTEQTTSCVGVANCEIVLYGADGNVITAPKFVIVVDEREVNYENIAESLTERNALDALMVSATTELERVEAEKARVEAEAGRVEAEEARAEAEDERVEAEEKRATAEAERAKAEEARCKNIANGAGKNSVVLNDVDRNIASGEASTAEGSKTVAIGKNAHAEGMSGKTLADKGLSTTSSATEIEAAWDADFPDKYASDTFGVAYGSNSHVEGRNTLALKSSHAEGCETKASADGSHSEGVKTKATGTGSHAEGQRTTASGNASHAQGGNTKATGKASSAGGVDSVAEANYSDAYGLHTIAKKQAQSVRGQYNADDSEAMFIVGAGTSTSSRRNAFSTGKDSSGNMFVKVGATKVTESMIKQALDAVSSVTGETTTWFEEVSTKGVLTLDSDVLPYVKLGKVYGKHYNIKANTPISLPDATIYETSWDETNKLVVKDNEVIINADSKAFAESISYPTGLTTPIDYDGKVRVYFLGGYGKINGSTTEGVIPIDVVGDGFSHTLQVPLADAISIREGENCISGLPSFPEYIQFPIPSNNEGDPVVYEDVSFDIYIESDTSYEQTFVVTGFETSEGERVDIPHTHFKDVVGYGLDKNYYDFADGKYYEWQTYDENGQLIDLEAPIVHDCFDKPSPYLKVSPGVTITPTGNAKNYPYTYSPNENTWECLIQRKVGG